MRGPRTIYYRALAIVLCLLFLGELAFLTINSLPETESPSGYWSEEARTADRNALVKGPQPEAAWVAIASALSLVLVITGIALMVSATSRQTPLLPPLLTLGALCSVCMTILLLLGLDLAYANFTVGAPVIENHWFQDAHEAPTNFRFFKALIYQYVFGHASGNLAVCLLLFGLSAGVARLPTVIAVALLATIFGYPLVVAWFDGNADLFNLVPVDSKGAFPIHVLAGSAGLSVILACRFLPPHSPRHSLQTTAADLVRPDRWHCLSHSQNRLLSLGMALFLVPLLAPSLLFRATSFGSGAEQMVDPQTLAILSAGVSALFISVFLRRRSRLHYVLVGCLAGWAVVAAAYADLTTWEAPLLGFGAGLLAPSLLEILDRLKCDDPFGIVPAQLVCGGLGALVAGFPSDSQSAWDWTDLLDQAGAILATGLLGFTIGGVVAMVAWLTGALWSPVRALGQES